MMKHPEAKAEENYHARVTDKKGGLCPPMFHAGVAIRYKLQENYFFRCLCDIILCKTACFVIILSKRIVLSIV